MYTNRVILDFSRRGKPTDNAAIESFNGRFREECLNVHWFESLEDATTKIEAGDRTTMRIILTELSRGSAPMNTLGERWNPLQSHSQFGPKNPVPSYGASFSSTIGPKKSGRSGRLGLIADNLVNSATFWRCGRRAPLETSAK